MRHRPLIGFVFSLTLVVSASAGAVGRSAAPGCGTTVVTSVTLDQDMTCPGDGLLVGADDIVIDLNGHRLTGAGVGVGITVRSHHGVTIQGGTVELFLTGIFITGGSSDVTVTESFFTGNREGVFIIGSSGNTVRRNVAWQNLLRGFMIRPSNAGVRSTNNVVAENLSIDNPSGILNFGQPGNTLEANWIVGSSFAAIDLNDGGAADNVIRHNLLGENAAGIRFMPGWTGNTIQQNWFYANTCALQGPTAGNTLFFNLFIRNDTKSCS